MAVSVAGLVGRGHGTQVIVESRLGAKSPRGWTFSLGAGKSCAACVCEPQGAVDRASRGFQLTPFVPAVAAVIDRSIAGAR